MRLEVFAERNSKSLHAGTIKTTPGYGESFTYADSWLEARDAKPLSMTLPLREEPFPAKRMRPYFEGLLPEGTARSAIAVKVHVSYAAYVKLLAAVGRECIGAVSFRGPSESPKDGYSPIDDGMLSRLADDAYPTAAETSERAHFSLAGSQAKIALYRGSDGSWFEPHGMAPCTHILKPAGKRFPDAAVNEFVCTLAAKALGIEVIDADGPIICTERFDRDLARSVRVVDGQKVPARLHQEDLCQAMGTVPEHKYEEGGIPYLDKVVELVGRVSTNPVADLWKLWDIVAFDYLIGNCDAHLKNIALLRDASWQELRLAPAYDLICTTKYEGLSRRMAMSIGDAHAIDDVSTDSFAKLAQTMALPKGRAMERLDRLSANVEQAVSGALAKAEAGGIDCEELGTSIMGIVRENVDRLRI